MSTAREVAGRVASVIGRRGVLAAAVVLVMLMEGTQLTAYQDTGGVWTICTGHTGDVKPGDTATAEECGDKTQADLMTAKRAVDRLVVAPVPLACQVAVIDFAYNLGPAALRRSRLLTKLNAGDPLGAADEFGRWVYVAGKDCRDPANNCRGIVFRREVEAALCRL